MRTAEEAAMVSARGTGLSKGVEEKALSRGRSGRGAVRYTIHDRIASGGMAAVYFGRYVGDAGFSRIVAVKRLHPGFADDRDAVRMLMEEAHLTARLHHPNIVPTLDVVVRREEAYVVMDYIHGESLSRLMRSSRDRPPSIAVVSSILCDTLRGLHSAHETRGELGEPLDIVHRDVSPQNIVVGADGVSRIIDFGIAKARVRAQLTATGQLRGKLSYLAPEQIRGESATRLADVYSAGVVLWEALTGRLLFEGDCAGAVTEQILVGWVDPPSKYVPAITEALDSVVLRALATEPRDRFATAAELADALSAAAPPAPTEEVAAWVRETAAASLQRRERRLQAIAATARSPEHAFRMPRGAALLAVAAIGIAVAAAAPSERAGEASRPPEKVVAPAPRPTPPSGSAATPDRSEAPAVPVPLRVAGASEGAATAHEPLHRRTRTLRAPAVRVATDDCDPPYDVDAAGIRIYKRHCLK